MNNDIIKEIKREENFMKLESKKTNFSKLAFIDEIKNGLGDEIKNGLGDEIKKSIEPVKKESFIKIIWKKIKSWITIN